MIHLSKVRKELSKQEPVSLKFWKENGEIVVATDVVQTSSYFKNDTINLKWIQSNEIRTIHATSIHELNGEEVCL